MMPARGSPDMPTPRRTTRADVPAITAIANHYARTSAANFATEDEPVDAWLAAFDATAATHPWLVVEDEDGVAGFAKASPWKGRCAYAHAVEVTVYLRPDALRRGLGRALYDRLFAILQAQGYRTALAGITLPNPGSVRLHEAMGMTRAAVFEAVGFKFGAWHDVGYWQVRWGEGAPGPVRSVDAVLAG